MTDYTEQNKKAWEYTAYDFWLKEAGRPADLAREIKQDPVGHLRKYASYFEAYEGVRVANICGSCGKKAIPLAVLGAEVTVFDISEDNKRYAMEVAEAADIHIQYEVCNVLEIDRSRYGGYFDIVFMEGGILHYFHDINDFMQIMNFLLKPGGKMICSDFHPLVKINDVLNQGIPKMSYFSTEVYEGEVAHAHFYEKEFRSQIPKCSLRKYTLSEIINSAIDNGFYIKRFDEHPAWTNPELPGEFTLIAKKNS